MFNYAKQHRDAENETLREFFEKSPSEHYAILMETSKPDQSKRSILSALRVISDDTDYVDYIRTMNELVSEKYAHDQKTKKNKISMDEIRKIEKEYRKLVAIDMSMDDKQPNLDVYNTWILICLTSGIYCSPRRLADFIYMRIKNIDKANDNYISKQTFVFNKYKTVHSSPQSKIVPISNELYFILRRWMQLNPTDYLIFQPNRQPYTPSALTKKLQKIYGKSVSVSAIRSIYTSSVLREDLKEVEEINDRLEQKAAEMGTSVNMLKTVYLKERG
ncbi:MAG: hypothetical protein EOO43_24180 [Flavobacterium sp.]|nr:MAG: hypothetical protein EOO43_24180 [Flavobacterium sp.]